MIKWGEQEAAAPMEETGRLWRGGLDGPGCNLQLSWLAERLDPPSARQAEALRQIASGDRSLVVTGQQPCFPLPLGLSLQKAATAIALATRLEKMTGRSFSAMFWLGSDDGDFAEAAGQVLPRASRSSLRIALPSSLHRRGRFVGDLSHALCYRELESLPSFQAEEKWRPEAEETLGEHHCRVLEELFAEKGLLAFDARSARLRRAAVPLYEKYARVRGDFAAAIDREGDRLEADSGLRPLRRGIGERALYFLKAGRRSQPGPEGYAAALAERLLSAPADLSANVALRPLVQDAVFPVAAVVLGPAEWEYHRQLRPAFQLMGITFPPPVPRLDLRWDHDGTELSRVASPMSLGRHKLAEPDFLIEAAEIHLDALAEGRFAQAVYQGA